MPSHRHNLIKELTGNEVFAFVTENSTELNITAKDLRAFCGGDIAKASIRPERGAHTVPISDFPNAEFEMREGDSINGLQDGCNVNFSKSQVAGKGADGSFQSPDGKIITVVGGLITKIE